ncbi:hypothetical protein ACYSNM_08530 [Myroides sp. LJL116]
MKELKLLSYSLLCLTLLFINSAFAQSTPLSIKGSIKNAPTDLLLKLRDMENNKWVDSTFVKDGEFDLIIQNQDRNYPIPYFLKLEQKDTIIALLLEPQGLVKMEIDYQNFNKNTIKGSPYQDWYEQLDSIFYQPYVDIISYRYAKDYYENLQTPAANEKVIKAQSIIEDKQGEVNQAISKYKANPVALYYIATYLNTYQPKVSVLQDFLSGLQQEEKNTKYAQAIAQYIKQQPKSLNDTLYNDKLTPIALSQVFTKDYLLIEVGSNYCGYSKDGQVDVLEVQSELSAYLDVISIHSDNDLEGLQEYSNNPLYNWNYLFDPNGRYSDFFIKYSITATPTYLLFNNQRELIKRWENNDNWTKELKEIIKGV